MIGTIRKTFTFSAAHYLPGHPSPCSAVHGHNWEIEIFAKGPIKDDLGNREHMMVMEFGVLNDIARETFGWLDHKFINELDAENSDSSFRYPTTEALASDWLVKMHRLDSRIFKVRVWETERIYAEVEIPETDNFVRRLQELERQGLTGQVFGNQD